VTANDGLSPLELAPQNLTFEQLDALRAYLERILSNAPASLRHYHDATSGGFVHEVDPEKPPRKPGDFSKASTATCLAFLAANGLIRKTPWSEHLHELRREIVLNPSSWSSAELPANNPFTTSFMLEAVHVLSGGMENLDSDERAVVRAKLALLNKELSAGGVRIAKYPPTSFLTQSVVRVLRQWDSLKPHARKAVDEWTWSNLHEESVLLASGSADADVFELAYSVLTASALAPLDEMTPQQRGVLEYALDQFFLRQRDDGGWPRSRPLFLYPNIGYAYCFDCELLVQLLSDPQLMPMIFAKLDKLARTAYRLDEQKYPLGNDAYGWSSGHHGRRRFAESWSTASVLHFSFMLHRYVAEAIRRAVFDYAGVTYAPPGAPPSKRAALPDSFLDSKVKTGVKSLKRVVQRSFLQPLVDTSAYVEEGQGFPENVPTSAIFFGPPGTSKTDLGKYIAESLGWPLLSLDPSHLTRNGLDRVHAEAHRLFGMLQSCERIVVLLDEFDELVREREEEAELESRFLTTAMLPKLAGLSKRRRIVYVLATNHLERFDIAIRRHGRFNMIIPVMPPTAAEKLRHWPVLTDALNRVKARDESHAKLLRGKIDELTYLECDALVRRLANHKPGETFAAIVEEESLTATMSQPVRPDAPSEKQTWRERLEGETERIRIPQA